MADMSQAIDISKTLSRNMKLGEKDVSTISRAKDVALDALIKTETLKTSEDPDDIAEALSAAHKTINESSPSMAQTKLIEAATDKIAKGDGSIESRLIISRLKFYVREDDTEHNREIRSNAIKSMLEIAKSESTKPEFRETALEAISKLRQEDFDQSVVDTLLPFLEATPTDATAEQAGFLDRYRVLVLSAVKSITREPNPNAAQFLILKSAIAEIYKNNQSVTLELLQRLINASSSTDTNRDVKDLCTKIFRDVFDGKFKENIPNIAKLGPEKVAKLAFSL